MHTIRYYPKEGSRTLYPVDFRLGFLDRSHVYLYIDENPETQIGYDWINDGQISLKAPIPDGKTLKIQRIVPKTLFNDYNNRARLSEQNLNDSLLQSLMLHEEVLDGFLGEEFRLQSSRLILKYLSMEGDIDMQGNRIFNLPLPLAAHEPVRLTDLENALGFLPTDLFTAEDLEEIKLGVEIPTGTFEFDTIEYTVGKDVRELDVFLNGSLLYRGPDYTETSSTSITLTPDVLSELQEDDIISVRTKKLVSGGGGNDKLPFVTTDSFYKTEDGDDYRPAIQRAIEFIEGSDIRQELRISPPKVNSFHSIKSLYPSEQLPTLAAGDKLALVIKKPNLLKIVGVKNRIQLDLDIPELRGITAMLAILPVTDANANELHIESVRLQGGAENTPLADRPEYIIKGDYSCIRYCRLKDVHISVSSKDSMIMCGFIMLVQHCRARFAGRQHVGFNCVVAPLDGIITGAKTGYHFDNCTVDYAGMYGFSLTGFNGHTYCKLTNCHVDFVGLDDNKQTIIDNVGQSSAYNLEEVWGVTLDTCGAEFCTRLLTGRNTRILTVDSLYGLGMGRNDSNTPVSELIKLRGFMEQVSLKKVFARNSTSGGFETPLRLQLINQFHASNIDVDSSINIDQVIVEPVPGFEQYNRSSKRNLVSSTDHFYESHTRRARGGAILDGEPLLGGKFNFWLNHENRAAEHSWKVNLGSSGVVTRPLLKVLNVNQDGLLGVKIEVLAMNSTTVGGVVRRMPATYQAYALCKNLNEGTEITELEKVGTLGADYNMSLEWITGNTANERVLRFIGSDPFSTYLIKATALGRTSTQTQHFYWE